MQRSRRLKELDFDDGLIRGLPRSGPTGRINAKSFEEIMEKSKEQSKPAQKPHWQPFDCESCNAGFDPGTWQAHWSLSGELTWSCPKCGHPNFPRLD